MPTPRTTRAPLPARVGGLPLAAYADPAYLNRMGTPPGIATMNTGTSTAISNLHRGAQIPWGLIPWPHCLSLRCPQGRDRRATAAAGLRASLPCPGIWNGDHRLQRLALGTDEERQSLPIWVVVTQASAAGSSCER